jgi:Uma2 family endonuclease
LPDDGRRYECIDGMLLVSPSPRVPHQRALTQLISGLVDYLRANPVGEFFASPSDVEIVRGHLVQPDVFVIAFPSTGPIKHWPEIKGLRLAVEILSPSTARYDRGVKRRFYTHSPTDEYWIVDADARVVERWRQGDDRPEVLTEQLLWQPSGAAKPMEIDLTEFFRAANGE